LRVPTSSSVIAPLHVDPVVGADRRLLTAELAVHEHVDVPAQDPALVEDPAPRRRVRALELRQQLPDRAAFDGVLGEIAGEALQRSAEAYDRHRLILRRERR
jgi:hypothetical protein